MKAPFRCETVLKDRVKQLHLSQVLQGGDGRLTSRHHHAPEIFRGRATEPTLWLGSWLGLVLLCGWALWRPPFGRAPELCQLCGKRRTRPGHRAQPQS